MSKGIEGKVVLVTGGSTGIGAAVARRLVASGAKVAVRRVAKISSTRSSR
ncbi:SDR family NAD(P)-dependent oxidoreductase [Paraburkholderia strydomiana]